MDQGDLYDEFGNYIGPELDSDEEEEPGYRQELIGADQTSDMVIQIITFSFVFKIIISFFFFILGR